jgi:hypothetical protein
MKNKTFLFLISIISLSRLSTIVHAMSNTIISVETTHTDINFIDIHGKGFFWYGSYGLNTKFIQFQYENHRHGWARIIFYPKNLKEKSKLDSMNKVDRTDGHWIRLYVMKNSSKFDIWVVFVDKAYDKDKPDAGDITVYEPTYPCKAELFKMDKNKWRFVKSTKIIKGGGQFNMFPIIKY